MAENPTAKPASEPTSGQGTEEEREARISPRIIVQSGAYYILLFGERYLKQIEDELAQAAQNGYNLLTEGGTAVDAVEEAVRLLEDSKYFNAGHGSLLNNDGEVECDAMIMDGHTMKTGAVMGARHFSNPVLLSRKIMEESYHCALSGEGALRFAERIGFPICDPNDLIEEEIKKRSSDLNLTYERYEDITKCYISGEPITNPNYDTVSAVALDSNGHFACATSTGGIPGKLKGRIGDAALVGCGGYANEHGAAAVGGHGEAIMKMTLAREVVYNIENGGNAQESAKNALQQMEDSIKGRGSAIAIDKNGIFGTEMNSTAMLWATVENNVLKNGMERKKERIRNKPATSSPG